MPSWKLSVFQRFKSCSALAPSPHPPSFHCSPRPSFDWMFDVSLLTSDLPPPLDYDYEHEHEHEWSRQFVLRHSFVIRAPSVFFASHFPLLVSLISPAGTRRPEPAPNPSSALPSPPFRLQPLRLVRAREANIARETSPKTQPHLPWSSAIPQSERMMRHKG